MLINQYVIGRTGKQFEGKQEKKLYFKEPVQCFCAGSCFDVPMCGALVQGISWFSLSFLF